jgi:hypothetical protein
MATVQALCAKIFKMNTGQGGVNRRDLFGTTKRYPGRDQSYAWMVDKKLVNEYRAEDKPTGKTPYMTELTERGRVFLDRQNSKIQTHSGALPPVAYKVSRDVLARVSVYAEMNGEDDGELLERIITAATPLEPILIEVAKKNRPDLFY